MVYNLVLKGEIRVHPNRLDLYEGDSMEVNCEHFVDNYSTQPFRAEWSRDNGRSIPTNFKTLSNNKLYIENVRESDSGTYKCATSNEYDTIYDVLSIKVYKRELIDLQIRVLEPKAAKSTIGLGARVTVECSSSSNYIKELFWSKVGGQDRTVIFNLS
jgi:hypothetical protein